MSIEKPNYQLVIERHYDAVLGLITHFITKLADEAVEMAARGVALAAPLPNAISMYNITQTDLGWHWSAALAFSLSLEVIVFLLVEIALMQWDGYLDQPRRYRTPFIAMIGVVITGVMVVMSFVYLLEPHKIMAALPIISLCSFVAIGLKRWHEKNVGGKVNQRMNQRKSKSESVNQKVNQTESNLDSPESVERVILNHYLNHPSDSQRIAAESLGLNQSKVNRILNQLESQGMIHRNGNGVEILNQN